MSLRTPAAKAIALGAALITLLVTGFGTLATTAIAAPSLGNLTWAVDASFRSYVTGPIGQGTVAATSPASDNGTTTTFTGSSNTIGSSPTGSAAYAGSVNFTAHSGALNLTFSNPTVRVVSETAAVLELTVNGSTVDFATLNLASASVNADASFVTFGSTPATLTAAGAQAFGGFYQEGRVLAPVTFAIPATSTPTASSEPSITPEPSVTPEPSTSPEPTPVEYGLVVSPTSDVEPGDTLTVTGTFPASYLGKTPGVYVMWCKEPAGEVGTAAGRISGAANCTSAIQQWISPSNPLSSNLTANAIVDDVWTFTTTIEVPATVGSANLACLNSEDSTTQCGIFTRLDHNYSATPGSPYYVNGDIYAFDQFIPVTFKAPVEYGLVVSPTSDVEPGDTLTVTGTFPASYLGKTPGVYVMWCKEPAGEVGTAAGRALGGVDCNTSMPRWVTPATPLSSTLTSNTVVDGVWTFTTTITGPGTVATANLACLNGEDSTAQCGVFARLDHTYSTTPGSPYYVNGDIYAFDQFIPVTFKAPVEYGLVVSPTSDVEPGDTLTVTGTFPASYLGKTPGVYVMWCKEPAGEVGTAAGRISGAANCTSAIQQWISPSNPLSSNLTANAIVDDVWTFTTTIEVPATVGSANLACLNSEDSTTQCGIFTRLDHNYSATPGSPYYVNGDIYAFDQFIPVTFKAPEHEPSPEPTVEPTSEPTTPTTPTTPPSPTTVGRLTWSIESDFTDYVTGSIAKGSVSVTGASASGNSYTFIQTGGSADLNAGTGTTTYGGTVRFVGHEGALDLTFASPSVRLTGPSSAVIVMTVNGQRVDFATVNLATATRTASGDAVRFSGASTTLTTAGAAAFNGFYSAGRALDPVTITFGVGTTEVFSGGTQVVKAAVTATTPVETTPPATEGIELDSDTLERLVAGETVTITVGGFNPGELVTVTVYSTPTVLAEGLVADASGNVTWTGSLPAGLTGEHTLVFSSASTAKGIVLTIPGVATTAARCEIQEATLTWGFKESFLAYLDSTIANGAWELSPEVTEGDQGFVFTEAGGDFDAQALEGSVNFTGSIRFTGHEGVLDTTVANPRVEFTAEGAFLILDVSGTTQGGEAVNEEGVVFASLDLDGATVTSDNGVTSITNAPVTLTEAGAAAFGTYPAGEALDPISLEIVGADCAVTESEASPSPSESAQANTAEAPTESNGTAPWLAIAIALGVVLVASGVGAGVTLRKRSGTKQ